jgi:DNA helicase-2/ATP-dependent DNA helicase PcrA
MELPRHAMDVFEPASSPLYDDESLADSIEQIDPWLHDGLPEIDINDSEGSLKISIAGSDDGSDDSLANDQDLGTAGMEPKLYRDQEPDDADDQSFGDSDDNSVRETKTLPAGFPRLVTGAQFAQEQEASAATRLHPDSFFIGMDVEHAEYGVGTVMTLSGEGQKRTATVDFKHIGKKRFRLAFSKLSQA